MEAFESALLPVLPLQDVVIFPHVASAITVTRDVELAALKAANASDGRMYIVCQVNPEAEVPSRDMLHEVGCVARIIQTIDSEDGITRILVEGLYPARATNFIDDPTHLRALIVRQDVEPMDRTTEESQVSDAGMFFQAYCELGAPIDDDLRNAILGLVKPSELLYAISSHCPIPVEEKLVILELESLDEKFTVLNSNLEREVRLMEIEDDLVSKVRDCLAPNQKENFLNQQMKAFSKVFQIDEEEDDEDASEIDELYNRIDSSDMSIEARERAEKEIGRLARMSPMSPEATVSRTYVEWLLDLPWEEATPDDIDLQQAGRILDEDHYGLEKVKERIIEYLAVTKLAGRAKGPIICLVGPPGVGKTSLAKSVARAIGRKFARISLGGLRDEAEIRGHRRTYIGALPGKIVQAMKKSGTVNPVILLDEIDKMASDFRGDPASALLEVLDPEQNNRFNDHYLEVDYDLSQVMFLTTANTMAGIPQPLEDRMEVIRLSGYTELEKMEIARRHLVPKAIKNNGLTKSQVSVLKKGLESLITNYTREAGVRNLEREINSVLRKIATKVVINTEMGQKTGRITVEPKFVRECLGPEKYKDATITQAPEIGNVLGLAWTEVGGELLHVESRTMPGKGNLILTGKLGEVMKESANTALSFIRSQSKSLGIPVDFHQNLDMHVHLPEGAIPKDGPSAGITLATSLISVLSGRAVRQDIAMTGEMTLRGKVLKIGGFKEKVLAAYRHKILTVIMPEDNIPDVEDVPTEIRSKMTFLPVHSVEEVLKFTLQAIEVPKVAIKKKAKRPQPQPRIS